MLCVCKVCFEFVFKLFLSDVFVGFKGVILFCELYCIRFWIEWVY